MSVPASSSVCVSGLMFALPSTAGVTRLGWPPITVPAFKTTSRSP